LAEVATIDARKPLGISRLDVPFAADSDLDDPIRRVEVVNEDRNRMTVDGGLEQRTSLDAVEPEAVIFKQEPQAAQQGKTRSTYRSHLGKSHVLRQKGSEHIAILPHSVPQQ
jgi:hypothetical protein